jgi:hypothetical protein
MSRIALAVILVTGAGMVACDDLTHRDQLSSVPRRGPTASPRRDNYPTADPAGHDSPDDPSISLVMQASYDGTMGITGTSVNYPYLTAVRVVARGLESRTPNYPEMGGAITRGPAQHASFGWVDGGVYSGTKILGAGGDMSIDTASGYYFIRGGLTDPGKSGYGYRVSEGTMYNGVRIWCGQIQTINPCDTWTGNTTFEFIRLQSTLTVAVDSSFVVPGSAVEFTWGASPAYVEGQQMPVVVDSTRWIPDPDSLGGSPADQPTTGNNACDYSIQQGHCKRRVIGSGTFVAKVYVNGKRFAGTMHVSIPRFRLTPFKKTGAIDRQVTFTPAFDDFAPFTNATWHWVADVGAGQTGECATGVTPCARNVHENGTMTVTVLRGGYPFTASAHVTVVPCAQNDSILDDPAVRKALDSLWKLSRPDTNSVRIERGMAVYDSLGTTVFRINPIDSTTDNACQNKGTIVTYPAPGMTLLAAFHTHPAHVGETVQCTSTKSLVYSNQYGGPSYNDWGVSATFTPRIPFYVMDKDEIYRMFDYPGPSTPNYWLDAVNGQGEPVQVPNKQYWPFYFQHKKRQQSSCTIV